MTDYTAMSDFEINCHVAEKAGIGDSMFFSSDESELAEEDPSKRGPIWNVPSWIQVKSWMPSRGNCFNPCNNPADAWPIILENGISLHAPRFKEGWLAEFTGSDDDVNDGFEVDYFEFHHANPLRAAMITFLVMKDEAVNTQGEKV